MDVLLYLLKVNVAVAVFCVTYRWCYRRDTFFALRRMILASMLCLAAVYPFIDLSGVWTGSGALTGVAAAYVRYVPAVAALPPSEAVAVSGAAMPGIILAMYVTVVAALLLRVAMQVARVVRLRLRCPAGSMGGVRVRLLKGCCEPFSFFGWIFVDPAMLGVDEAADVVAHEAVHARERHSLDVIAAELLCACCWVNPAAWMLRGEIRRNLEFLADSGAVRGGADTRSYQYHLLRLACSPTAAGVTNKFNVSPLKERIMMLNVKQSPAIKRVAYTLVLPLAALLLAANSAGATVDRLAAAGRAAAQSIAQSVRLDTATGRPVIFVNGTLRPDARLDDINPSTIENISVLKNESAERFLKMNGIEVPGNGVVMIETKNPTAAEKAAIERLNRTLGAGEDAAIQKESVPLLNLPGEGSDAPAVFVNGTLVTGTALSSIDPNTIENITVLKDATAQGFLKSHGISAPGRGVVLIETKNPTAAEKAAIERLNRTLGTGPGAAEQSETVSQPERPDAVEN